jgi:hypothetical protein
LATVAADRRSRWVLSRSSDRRIAVKLPGVTMPA